jgi:hypothetical protein
MKMNQVKYYRKRYVELLKMLNEEKTSKEYYEHVLDQLEGVERELYRLGQHEWMQKTANKYVISE